MFSPDSGTCRRPLSQVLTVQMCLFPGESFYVKDGTESEAFA